MIELCDFSDDEEFKEWLSTDHLSSLVFNNQNRQIAYDCVLNGWRERAQSRHISIPCDLTGSCKFSSLFIKLLFGGKIQGNEYHQYNLIENKIVDLNENAKDVKNALYNPYIHDSSFFANEEHLDSMRSCLPRLMSWIENYKEVVKQDSIKKLKM